jgi:hypothetical protein
MLLPRAARGSLQGVKIPHSGSRSGTLTVALEDLPMIPSLAKKESTEQRINGPTCSRGSVAGHGMDNGGLKAGPRILTPASQV